MRILMKALHVPFMLTLILLPSVASAQASITGVVRDLSDAVLPGVSVEAESPALIEKVRSVVTDGSGQYRIENLRPGTYTVTFTLPGFSTVKRESIELSGSFVATINAELRVGAIEETVQVRGESPIVDVQRASKQTVIDQDVVKNIPTGRNATVLAALVPGVRIGRLGDAGGIGDTSGDSNGTIHGSAAGQARLESNGLSLSLVGGSNQQAQSNMSAIQEVTVDTSGMSAEASTGGVRVNMVPKEGGNRVSGVVFGAFANESMQADNFDDALRTALGSPNTLKRFADFNPGMGGPIVPNKLWYYGAYKSTTTESYASGVYVNRNANNPNVWTYDPDLTSRPFNNFDAWDLQARLTWQISNKVKMGISDQEGYYCACTDALGSGASPEAVQIRRTPKVRNLIADFTAPMTSRVLLEGAVLKLNQDLVREVQPDYANPAMIAVVEQALNNFIYRTVDQSGTNPNLRSTWFSSYQGRFAASYITGAHAFKTGVTYQRLKEVGWLGNQILDAQRVTYRFNNGIPNQITLFGYPVREDYRNPELGWYAQDKWTFGRTTLGLGVRYDYHTVNLPASVVGPTSLLPNRNLSFPASKPVAWHDLTPRLGLARDVFGTGKTAFKVGLNKYLDAHGRFGRTLNPATRIGNSTTRAWNDADRDYVPDCDLVVPQANGECGALANQNFGGSTLSAAYDSDLLFGWGRRSFNWEFTTGVQHELFRGVSLEVGYFRRWFGNFFATDNRAVSPADFTAFSVTAPTTDSRLPSAGQTITGYYNLNPDKVGQVDEFVTRASNYGKQTQHWNGVDVNLSARLPNGIRVQGGTSTGRTTRDSCEIRAALPESAPTNPFCKVAEPLVTDFKLFATYIVPVIKTQLSGNFQRSIGPAADANYVASNALVAPSLGRPLSGGAANVTVPLIPLTSLYSGYVAQLDFRVAKPFSIGWARAVLNLDVYNMLNENSPLTVNTTLGGAIPWQQPRCTTGGNSCDTVMRPRLLKISAQLDF